MRVSYDFTCFCPIFESKVTIKSQFKPGPKSAKIHAVLPLNAGQLTINLDLNYFMLVVCPSLACNFLQWIQIQNICL